MTELPMWKIEREYHQEGICSIAGVDEAGRGSLCGPVVAAAFIPRTLNSLPTVRDSKQLSPSRREHLYWNLLDAAEDYSIGFASPREIDDLNILRATMLAMQRALQALNTIPDLVLVDGNHLPDILYPAKAVVGGDNKVGSIAAASILAKVTRDSLMKKLHETFPLYGFDRNMGYATAGHREALRRYGPTPIHRLSFNCVRQPKLVV